MKLHRTHDAMLLLIILGKYAMDAVACLLQRLGLGRWGQWARPSGWMCRCAPQRSQRRQCSCCRQVLLTESGLHRLPPLHDLVRWDTISFEGLQIMHHDACMICSWQQAVEYDGRCTSHATRKVLKI